MRSRGLLLAVVVLCSVAPPAGAEATVRCHLTDPRIGESSGLVVAGDALFTHNDSGDLARFFALSADCDTIATFDVTTVAYDWEDMSGGPASDGDGAALYLADIGDNSRARPALLVHEVAVPDPTGGDARLEARTHLAFYADGPRDAETFAVLSDGRFLVVEKTAFGPSGVYLDDGPGLPVRLLRRVAEIDLDAIASPYVPLVHFSRTSRLLTTAGDLSADATRFVVRTYVEAFEWSFDPSDVAGVFDTPPEKIALPQVQQGEAIGYADDGRTLVTTTEGALGPVHEVARD